MITISDVPNNSYTLLAEETGWHIGDGSMNYYENKTHSKGLYQLRGHLTEDKDHYITRIKPIFEKVYGCKINLREMPSTGVFGFQIWNDRIVSFKHNLGLPLGKKWDIKIPKVFLKKEKLAKLVVRGIFDTDGCVSFEHKRGNSYPHIHVNTISFPLAKQIHSILLEFNLRVNIYTTKRNFEQNRPNPIYRVEMVGQKMLNKFFNKISPKNSKHINKYLSYRKSF